jgi:spore coat protein U-like protein
MQLKTLGRAALYALALASPAAAGTVTDTFDVTLTIQAGCEVSAPNDLSFGTATFLDTALTATEDFSVRCTNGTTGTISLNGGSGSSGSVATRTMESGANAINYSLYTNSSHTTIWGTADSTSRFALAYRNCCLACNSTSSFSVTSAPFMVSASVVAGCTVTANDLSFGTASLLNSNVDSTSSVSVTCTSGLGYAVGLSQGTTPGGTTTTRLMKHASAASTVPYGMYSDAARTANWGNSTSDDVNGTGTGSAVNHTVYGRVPAQGVAPEAGSYSDTVTVTITY